MGKTIKVAIQSPKPSQSRNKEKKVEPEPKQNYFGPRNTFFAYDAHPYVQYTNLNF